MKKIGQNSTEAGEKAMIFPKQKKASKICKHVENHGKRPETHRNCRKPRKIEEGTGSKERKTETTKQKQKRKKARTDNTFQTKRLSSGPFLKRYFGNVTMHMLLRFSSLRHHSSWLRCCHVVRNQRQAIKSSCLDEDNNENNFVVGLRLLKLLFLFFLFIVLFFLFLFFLFFLFHCCSCSCSHSCSCCSCCSCCFAFVLVRVGAGLLVLGYCSSWFCCLPQLQYNPQKSQGRWNRQQSKINNKTTTNSSMSVCTKATTAKPAAKVRKHRSQKNYTNRPQWEIGPSIFSWCLQPLREATAQILAICWEIAWRRPYACRFSFGEPTHIGAQGTFVKRNGDPRHTHTHTNEYLPDVFDLDDKNRGISKEKTLVQDARNKFHLKPKRWTPCKSYDIPCDHSTASPFGPGEQANTAYPCRLHLYLGLLATWCDLAVEAAKLIFWGQIRSSFEADWC